MSEPDLPDDLARWPTNPYQLLGVQPGVLPRDLRRAYTRLIRIYKPEKYPDHFRRIRDAYETLMRWIGSYSPIAESSVEDLPAAQPVQEDTNDSPALKPFAALRTLEEELDEAWQAACAGDEAAAYRQLRDLHDHFPNDASIYLRLYWLLAIAPKLDGEKTACDWLTEGLRVSGLTGPLRELYRRELADNPREARSDRCRRLLNCDVRPGLLLDLVEWRWRAASAEPGWQMIIERDLEILRERIATKDEETWVRMLLLAVRRLAWAETRFAQALMEGCRKDWEQFQHLHLRLSAEFDQKVYEVELARGWLRVIKETTRVSPLLSLIPMSLHLSAAEMRSALIPELNTLADDPFAALDAFDRIEYHARPVLAQIGRMLQAVRYETELPRETRSEGELTNMIFSFLAFNEWSHYKPFRGQLLNFCLQEHISPAFVATQLEQEAPQYLTSNECLYHVVGKDWPMQYVYLAHELFWA